MRNAFALISYLLASLLAGGVSGLLTFEHAPRCEGQAACSDGAALQAIVVGLVVAAITVFALCYRHFRRPPGGSKDPAP